MNVARYVLRRLKSHGVDVLFGIPGTSCAAVFDEASGEGITTIISSSELEAGYAADAYARFRGLAAVSVSYGVGTLSMVNPVAGALVERSPVVVLNGGPSAADIWTENHRGALFSHSTGRPSTDLRVFEQVTAFAARAESADDVPRLMDRALTVALREKRPVYLEIPRDLWRASCPEPSGLIDAARAPVGSEPDLAVRIVGRLQSAVRPAVILGEEIARYGLRDEAAALLRYTGLPWATTLLSKSVLAEDTPNFAGVYDSDLAPKHVRSVIEGSDLLLALGCVFSVDHTFLVNNSFDRMVHVWDGAVRIQELVPQRGELGHILAELNAALKSGLVRRSSAYAAGDSYVSRRSWIGSRVESVESKDCLTHEELFATIDASLSDGWLVIADTCLGSYPAADLAVRGADSFLGNPVWLSIGHSVGAAVGAAARRRPPGTGDLRGRRVSDDGSGRLNAREAEKPSRGSADRQWIVRDRAIPD